MIFADHVPTMLTAFVTIQLIPPTGLRHHHRKVSGTCLFPKLIPLPVFSSKQTNPLSNYPVHHNVAFNFIKPGMNIWSEYRKRGLLGSENSPLSGAIIYMVNIIIFETVREYQENGLNNSGLGLLFSVRSFMVYF